MGDFPQAISPSLHKSVITPLSDCAIPDFRVALSLWASIPAWPTTNLGIFVPFAIEEPITAIKMAWMNGTTLVNNSDIGIYDFAGNRLVSSGSVARAGSGQFQLVDIADTTLQPGYYYMAMSCDGTSANTWSGSNNVIWQTLYGIKNMASAFPLPSTATFVSPTVAFVPLISVITR